MIGKKHTLEENLSYLRLTQIRDSYMEAAIMAAKKNMSHIDFLDELIGAETAARETNAVARRLREARLPYSKTLEQFQWSHPEKINRQQIENLFHLNFMEKKVNVVFLAGCGLGKTHLSIALAAKACQEGYSVLFAGAVDIVNSLSAAKAVNGSMLITCNKVFKKWAEIFNNDSTVTSAILDRVLHHCEPVVIEGKSYRMKDK